jgi:Zn-dependent protease
MQSGWRVGSLFGIPVLINPSLFFVIFLVTLSASAELQRNYANAWGAQTVWGIGLATALLLFLSVLLHELGHSLVAKLQGIRVQSITLFFLGGIASIDQEPKTPGKAFQVAIAGPLVSLALFLLFGLAGLLIPSTDAPLHILFSRVAGINLVLALFNLIPGLPLDGGQVLKSIIWKITGSQIQGIRWAASTGRILGLVAIAWGLADTFGVSRAFGIPRVGGLWVALIGWFIVQNADAYNRTTDLQEALLKIKSEDAMTRDFRVVDANMTLRRFADDHLLVGTRAPVYYAVSNGRYRGMVDAEGLQLIERSQWETQTLFKILQPLGEVPTVQESTPIVDVIQLLEDKKLPRITVLSPAEAVAGVIDRGDIVRALGEKMNFRISETIIKQIKEEGTYPPGLRLSAIAQSAAGLK